jgi:hypothetical protein
MIHDAHRCTADTVAAVAGRRVTAKSCGHSGHVGTCPRCQQTQLARWEAQLSEAKRSGAPGRSAA